MSLHVCLYKRDVPTFLNFTLTLCFSDCVSQDDIKAERPVMSHCPDTVDDGGGDECDERLSPSVGGGLGVFLLTCRPI